MSDVPPQFVAYPRGLEASQYGTTEQLVALGEAYFELNYVFGLAIVFSQSMIPLEAANRNLFLISIPFFVLVMSAASFRSAKKAGFGLNWPSWKPVVASILLGLNFTLCCGVIGFIVLQQIIAKELKNYGLRYGSLGIKKKSWLQTVKDRQSQANQAPR